MSDNNVHDQLNYEEVHENGGEHHQATSSSLGDHENGGSNEVTQSGGEAGNIEPMSEDPDLFDIKQRVKGMDEEAQRLIQLQSEMEQQMKSAGSPTTNFGPPYAAHMSAEEKQEIDARSIYVGNVDYSATAQELEAHFHGCGSINRVTILCDKFTGHPKGFAYIEFGDKDSVQTAMALDESLFKGRQIKVVSKRTNRPGISSTDRPPRGSRGGYSPYGPGGYGAPRGRGGMYGMPMRGGGGGYMKSFRGKPIRGARGGFFHYAPY